MISLSNDSEIMKMLHALKQTKNKYRSQLTQMPNVHLTPKFLFTQKTPTYSITN